MLNDTMPYSYSLSKELQSQHAHTEYIITLLKSFMALDYSSENTLINLLAHA